MHAWLQFHGAVRRLANNALIDRNDCVNLRAGGNRKMARQFSKYEFERLTLRIADCQALAQIVIAVFPDVNSVVPPAHQETVTQWQSKPAAVDIEVVRSTRLHGKLN